jgi:N-acetyl-D-muramate 6-phosphate phosphatase
LVRIPLTTARAVVFDHDGTLIDSAPAVVAATNAVLVAAGLPPSSSAAIVAGMALPTAPRMGVHAGISDPVRCAGLAAAFYDAFRRSLSAPAFPGMADVVAGLAASGRPIAVVSNNEGRSVRSLLATAGMLHHCRVAWGEEDVPAPKPDPRGLALAAARLGLRPEACVYVGDAPVDAAAATAAGMDSILVSWGVHPRPGLIATGRPVADSVVDLRRLLG